MVGWANDAVRVVFERFTAEAAPWIERRTVVIYACVENGNPVPIGSGVLFQIADRHFVLTAGHVLAAWGTCRYVIALGNLEPIDLTTTPAEVSPEHQGDLALVPLTDEMVRRIAEWGQREFARLSELDAGGDEPRPGVHAIAGYPLQVVERPADGTIVSPLFFYPSLRFADSAGRDPGLLMALEIDDENLDADGDRARVPHLEGISGSGLWRLHATDERAGTWSVERIKLVGIEHHVIGTRVVIGTRIRHVLAGLADRFPDLERPVELAGIRIVRRAKRP